MSVQQAIQWQISVKAMSPGAIDMVKIIALTAMLVDHLNILFLHPPLTGTVRTGSDGVSSVCHHLGAESEPQPGIAAGQSKPPVDMGPYRTGSVLAGVSPSSPLVCPEHSVCVRRRHAAGRTQPPLRGQGRAGRINYSGCTSLSAGAGQLRIRRSGFRSCTGGFIFSGIAEAMHPAYGHYYRHRRAVQPERHHTSYRTSLDTLIIAILPTLILPFVGIWLAIQLKPAGSRRFMPSRFFYHAYAGHLLLLALCRIILN